MIGKKINQLATELAPVSTDLTIIGDPVSGVSKKITLAQLGAIFSGAVSFYNDFASFPATGDINVIYCAKDTKKLYLWSGSAYVEVFPSQALLDTYQLRSEKGNANGYASLDSSGKVPISQLPSSIMEYKGTWSAATNTPTLANGTGDTGDVYLCNAAGTVNFGAGPLTFAVGDYVVYSGTIWQRSSGAVGTVTSVAATITGDAIGITGSPVTTSGTLAFAFGGNSTQYINGAGNLITFPSIISQAANLVTEVYNKTGATLTKGTIVYINGGQGNLPTITKAIATGDSTSAQTFGIVQADITNNNNGYVVIAGRLSDIDTQAYTEGTQLYLSSTTAGTWTSTKQYAPAHLVYVGIVVRAHPTQGVVEVKIQNGYELDELHNVAAQTPSNNDGLFWEASTSLWKNKSIATILGYTPQAQLNGTGFVKASGTTITYDNSTYVTTDTFQTISASKTFGVGFSIASAGGTNQLTSFLNTNSIHSGSAGTNVFGFNNSNNIYFGKGLSNGGVITYNNSAVRFYALPDADGTIALVGGSGVGTVTSVAALTLGTSGTDLSSTVANGTTTPVITLNVPTASATNRGVLSAADWTKFNNNIPAGTPATGDYVFYNGSNLAYRNFIATTPLSYNSSTATFSISQASGSANGFLSSTDWTTFNNKQNALTNPVTGTGTTNYLPKFTGTSTIGNSLVYDNGNGIAFNGTNISYAATNRGNITINGTSGIIGFNNSGTAMGYFFHDGTNMQMWNELSGSLIFGNSATTRMTINASGNLGLGVTPSAWISVYKAINIGSLGLIYSRTDTDDIAMGLNWYRNSGGSFLYNSNGHATIYAQNGGQHLWYSAPSGTAGNAISFTQAMTLNASGNLSVGNTNDTYKLDVSGASRILASTYTAGAILYLRDAAATGSNTTFGGLFLGSSPGTDFVLGKQSTNVVGSFAIKTGGGTTLFTLADTGAATFSSSVTAKGDLFIWGGNAAQAGQITANSAGGGLYIAASGTNQNIRLVPSGTGFVQVISALDVSSSVTATELYLSTSNGVVGNINSTNANGGYITWQTSGTTIADIGTANQIFGSGGSDVFGINGRGARAIAFGTNNTERMRITSSGNVGINTTSPSYLLDVNGTARFGSAIVASLGTGLVYSSGGTLTSTNPSDQRLKNNIKSLSYGLNEILQLNPKTFYYNDDVNKERLKYGFIAQDVKNIMPELARKLNAETDYLGLETEGIYVTLVNAIKELKAELDTLKNK